MTRDEIDRILGSHFAAEQKRDINAILATYTEDIEHDAVGRDPNPITGKAAIGVFYREFLNDLEHAKVIPVRRFYGDDFAVDESIVEGYAHGRPYDLRVPRRPHLTRERVARPARHPAAAHAAAPLEVES
jgi:hypothetical protein